MYVGLAYGAKQLSEWLAIGDGLNADGTKSGLFDVTKERNTEIMSVGNFLFDKNSTAIYYTGLSVEYFDKFYIDNIADSSLLNSATDDLIISIFEDDTDTKYMLVVNKNTADSVTGTITLDAEMEISKLDKSAGIEIEIGNSNSIDLEISAGGGEVYILK